MKKIIITIILIGFIAFIAFFSYKVLESEKQNGDNLDDILSSTKTTNMTVSQAQENSEKDSSAEITVDSKSEMTPEEMVAATSNIPSYAISWDVEDVVEYNGGELTTEVTITNGSFKMEKGFSISLNGVLQECVIECDGKKTERTTMPTLVFAEGQERTFKISFTPNIGTKNDVLEMSLVHSYLPNYRITEDMEIKVIMGNQNSLLCGGNIKLKFNIDAINANNITDNYSGAKVGKLNKVIYTSHYYENVQGDIFNDVYEANRLVLYHDFYKVYSISEGVNYDNIERFCSMTVPRSEKTTLTINVYGKPGKRRVSLLINNELQPVFDGKYYADVEFKEGEQVELVVEINTSDLDKYNCIYALSKELNEAINPTDHLLVQSSPYVLIVQ